MAESSVSDFASLINQQIEVQEILSSRLSKIEALLHVALDDHFLDCSKNTQYEYLYTLSDLVYQSLKHNESALNFLLKYQQPEGRESQCR
jgi:hypothetical protein